MSTPSTPNSPRTPGSSAAKARVHAQTTPQASERSALGSELGDAASSTGSIGSPANTTATMRAESTEHCCSHFCDELSSAIGAHRFGLWFENGTSARLRDGSIVIEAANAYVADWIGRNFREAMQRAAEKAVGAGTTVAVEVATNELERAIDAAANADAAHRSATRQRSRDRDGADAPNSAHGREDGGAMRGPAVEPLELAGRPRQGGAAGSAGIGHAARSTTLRRLEDFVVGESNRLAFAASLQVADGASDAPGILFLHGDCGVGKTHLLQGIVRRRTQRAPRQVVRYVTAEQFTNEYIAAVRDGSLDQFRKRLRRVDLLAIDDIHFFANKSATQAEFLHTIDAIDLTGARVALVSDEHPRHIRKFSQSLVSRFLSGMVVRVERPDRDTRSQLVRRLARERGLDLTTAAEDLVAGRCAGSIREIEGAITRLGALVELDGLRGQIGPGSVERLLGQDGATTGTTTPIRLGSIVEAVCDRLRVSREDLLGNGRHARTVVARGMVAHLAREMTTHSYPEIARALGRDTHSAVHAAAKRLKSLIDADGRIGSGGEPVREVTDQLRHDLARGAAQR